MVQPSHPYMTTGKSIALIRWTFVGKVMFLLFNMLYKSVKALLQRSKSFNFMAAVTICSDFGPQENEVCHCVHYFPICLPWNDGTRCHDLCFLNADFKPNFHSTLSLSSRGSSVSLHFLLYGWCNLHIWDYWYFSQQSWVQLVLHWTWHFTWCTLHIS